MNMPTAVLPHNPRYLRLFQREAEDLADILGSESVIAHHIGSTAIPGAAARPILDLIIEVRSLDHIEAYTGPLAEFGYTLAGEQGILGRRFYIKNDAAGRRTHNLYIFQAGHPEVQNCLDFRDYLLVHPDDAYRYSLLKQELAASFGADLAGYMQGKDGFIHEMLGRARAWRQASPKSP